METPASSKRQEQNSFIEGSAQRKADFLRINLQSIGTRENPGIDPGFSRGSSCSLCAEGERFELSVRFPGLLFSRQARSTTPPSLPMERDHSTRYFIFSNSAHLRDNSDTGVQDFREYCGPDFYLCGVLEELA